MIYSSGTLFCESKCKRPLRKSGGSKRLSDATIAELGKVSRGTQPIAVEMPGGSPRRLIAAVREYEKLTFLRQINNGYAESGHLVLRAIESPVLNRFRHMGIGDAFDAREIRNRTRDLEYTVIAAR
jgi:hypothetical protein